MTVFVLVHSPFVGPLTWYATARALEQKGHVTVVPTLGRSNPRTGHRYRERDRRCDPVAPSSRPVRARRSQRGGPCRSSGESSAAGSPDSELHLCGCGHPPRRRQPRRLDPGEPWDRDRTDPAQATAGLLPPWGTGWPEETWRRLIPDASLRAQFIAESGPTPLALYEERVSWPAVAWPDAPCKYLRFSEPYADAEHDAKQSGWVTREIASDHLHMLVRPTEVAECLIDLA